MNKKRFCIFIVLFCLWMIFSGIFQAKFLALGAAAAAIISIITTPLLVTERKGKRYFVLEINYIKFLKYFCWLLVEIVKSTFEVCRAIIFPKKYAKQQIIKFYCPFENPMAIVLLTNSIILTPGTVTVDVTDDDYFVVHALTEVAAKGIFDGDMMRRVGLLYGEKSCLECSARLDKSFDDEKAGENAGVLGTSKGTRNKTEAESEAGKVDGRGSSGCCSDDGNCGKKVKL